MADAATLIRAYCRRGDRQAFHRFYQDQAPRLWRYLVARGHDSETAYDLVAEAFLRFIQSVCRDDRAPVGLLYRIAVNLGIDHYRRGQVRATVDTDPDSLPAAGPADDRQRHLLRLLQDLPQGEQNLLLLRYWIGLSHKEVARALDLPPGTVRRRCAAAIKRLRQRWDDT